MSNTVNPRELHSSSLYPTQNQGNNLSYLLNDDPLLHRKKSQQHGLDDEGRIIFFYLILFTYQDPYDQNQSSIVGMNTYCRRSIVNGLQTEL